MHFTNYLSATLALVTLVAAQPHAKRTTPDPETVPLNALINVDAHHSAVVTEDADLIFVVSNGFTDEVNLQAGRQTRIPKNSANKMIAALGTAGGKKMPKWDSLEKSIRRYLKVDNELTVEVVVKEKFTKLRSDVHDLWESLQNFAPQPANVHAGSIPPAGYRSVSIDAAGKIEIK